MDKDNPNGRKTCPKSNASDVTYMDIMQYIVPIDLDLKHLLQSLRSQMKAMNMRNMPLFNIIQLYINQN